MTLALNWLVAFTKLLYGASTQCTVIFADGVHSFSDGASNVIGLMGIWLSRSGKPSVHHQKYETLASMAVGVLLFFAAFHIFRNVHESFEGRLAPQIGVMSFVVMVLTLALNLCTVLYERQKGKALNSDLLISDSWHTLTDVFITLSVFIALIGLQLHISGLDAFFSLGIGCVILYTAVRIIRSGWKTLQAGDGNG